MQFLLPVSEAFSSLLIRDLYHLCRGSNPRHPHCFSLIVSDEEKGGALWSPSPPRTERRPISIDLSGSEEEPEQTEAQ